MVCKGWYPLSRPGNRSYNTFVDHVIKGVLNLFSVLHEHLPLGRLDWGNGGVSPDSVNSIHVAYGIKGPEESSLQGNNVLGCCSG